MSFPAPCQIAEVQVQVSQNTEALQGAQMEIGDLTRQLQTLEIELASQQSLVRKYFWRINIWVTETNVGLWHFFPINPQKASLEDTLRNTDIRNNMEMEKYNAIIMRLEDELTKLRANIQNQTQDYEVLLNMKMKLEAEISTYKVLLDGGDFK